MPSLKEVQDKVAAGKNLNEEEVGVLLDDTAPKEEGSPAPGVRIATDVPFFLEPDTEYQAHPYTALFPMMEGEEAAEFGKDVADNGIHDPVTLDMLNRILDGRNREKYGRKAGVKVPAIRIDLPDDKVLDWVLSKNLHRRHLTTGQRAVIAKEIANMGEGGDHSAKLPSGAAAVSQAAAAKALNVSTRSVTTVAAIKKRSPSLHADVKAGKITLGKAARTVRGETPKRRATPKLVAAEIAKADPNAPLSFEEMEASDALKAAAKAAPTGPAADTSAAPAGAAEDESEEGDAEPGPTGRSLNDQSSSGVISAIVRCQLHQSGVFRYFIGKLPLVLRA